MLVLVLRWMIPQTIKVVILADRGFRRTALARFCQQQHFGYIIRIQPKVTVRLHGFHGPLLDYPVHKGIAKVLKRVSYRADGAVTQSVIIRWPHRLPKKRDECWFLMTDQPGTTHQLCRVYGKRMTIEELFRDDKSKRNGWSLRDTQTGSAGPIAIGPGDAYLLLCGVGLIAKARFTPAAWYANNRDNECSIYTIGMIMYRKMNVSPPQAMAK